VKKKLLQERTSEKLIAPLKHENGRGHVHRFPDVGACLIEVVFETFSVRGCNIPGTFYNIFF